MHLVLKVHTQEQKKKRKHFKTTGMTTDQRSDVSLSGTVVKQNIIKLQQAGGQPLYFIIICITLTPLCPPLKYIFTLLFYILHYYFMCVPCVRF